MSAIFFPIFEFFARNKWAQIALVVVVAILTLGMYVHGREEKAKREQKRLNDLANARERARMVEASTQVKEELHERADEARDAVADLPVYPVADSLRNDRPDLARIVFGDRPGNGG